MNNRHFRAVVILVGFLATPSSLRAQESCSAPMVIQPGTMGQMQFDLVAFDDDHDGCGQPMPGADAVFFANGSDVEFTFALTHLGITTETLTVDFTFWCDPDSACESSWLVPAQPFVPITFRPTISQPIYVVVHAPVPSPVVLPLRVDYSLQTETQVLATTWGRLKALHR